MPEILPFETIDPILTTQREFAKSQNVRLFDVFFLGPMILYIGVLGKKPNTFERGALIAFGVGTILYNGRNYYKNTRLG